MDGWKRTLLIVQADLSLLRSASATALRPGLPTMLSHAEEASQGEKVDLRQPACHALARIAVTADGLEPGGASPRTAHLR